MRYIAAGSIKEGMVLARSFYGPSYEVLIGEGMTLSNVHIQRLNRLGYAGAYVEDDLSAGIEIEELVSDRVRLDTIRAAKETWLAAEQAARGKKKTKVVRNQQDKITMPIIEGLIGHPHRVVELIDLKPEEDYLHYHSANVVILSILIGVELGLSGTQLHELGVSALLHDVGNIFIPRNLLDKRGKLTPEEYETIKSHTQLGFDYLRDNYEISIEGCMGALQHHENYDGTGYPAGLKKDKISIYGRIIAITDVYDALTSRRPYREMLYPPSAMDYLDSKAGTMFDPDIVKAFQRVVPLYPAGLCVELDSGVRGIVSHNYAGYPDRPRIQLLNTNAQVPMFIDLHKDAEYKDNYVARIVE